MQARTTSHDAMGAYQVFWQQLIDHVSGNYPMWELPRKAPQKSWISFPGPTRGIGFRVLFRDDLLFVGVGLNSRDPALNTARHKALESMAESMSLRLGRPATWSGPHSVWNGYNLDVEMQGDISAALSGSTGEYLSFICESLESFRIDLDEVGLGKLLAEGL